jgi:adenosylcobinamide amidohydrolase
MHDVIHRALTTQVELDRLTAASAARTRRALKQAKKQAGPTTSGALRVRRARFARWSST